MSSPTSNPTAVMGRRIGAAAIDTVIFGGLFAAMFAAWSTSLSGMPKDTCDLIRIGDDFNLCYQIDDRVHFVLGGRAWLVVLLPIVLSVVNLVVLQAFTGMTLGKTVTGIRTVNAAGRPPGIGRALGRWALLAVDWFPWCVPAVGLATSITDEWHRRVGDRLLDTYVVERSAMGRPPNPGTVPAPPGTPGSPLPPPL